MHEVMVVQSTTTCIMTLFLDEKYKGRFGVRCFAIRPNYGFAAAGRLRIYGGSRERRRGGTRCARASGHASDEGEIGVSERRTFAGKQLHYSECGKGGTFPGAC